MAVPVLVVGANGISDDDVESFALRLQKATPSISVSTIANFRKLSHWLVVYYDPRIDDIDLRAACERVLRSLYKRLKDMQIATDWQLERSEDDIQGFLDFFDRLSTKQIGEDFEPRNITSVMYLSLGLHFQNHLVTFGTSTTQNDESIKDLILQRIPSYLDSVRKNSGSLYSMPNDRRLCSYTTTIIANKEFVYQFPDEKNEKGMKDELIGLPREPFDFDPYLTILGLCVVVGTSILVVNIKNSSPEPEFHRKLDNVFCLHTNNTNSITWVKALDQHHHKQQSVVVYPFGGSDELDRLIFDIYKRYTYQPDSEHSIGSSKLLALTTVQNNDKIVLWAAEHQVVNGEIVGAASDLSSHSSDKLAKKAAIQIGDSSLFYGSVFEVINDASRGTITQWIDFLKSNRPAAEARFRFAPTDRDCWNIGESVEFDRVLDQRPTYVLDYDLLTRLIDDKATIWSIEDMSISKDELLQSLQIVSEKLNEIAAASEDLTRTAQAQNERVTELVNKISVLADEDARYTQDLQTALNKQKNSTDAMRLLLIASEALQELAANLRQAKESAEQDASRENLQKQLAVLEVSQSKAFQLSSSVKEELSLVRGLVEAIEKLVPPPPPGDANGLLGQL